MIELRTESPLRWPTGIERTERFARHNQNGFQPGMTEADALRFLKDELMQLEGVESAVFTSDYVNIGTASQSHKLSMDCGASLHFKLDKRPYHLCCDRWSTVAHNIYAIHLALRYFRQMQQWGIGTMHRLMAGYSLESSLKAEDVILSTQTETHKWREFLGLGPTATLEDANAVYRHRAKTLGEHNPDALMELNAAIQQARKYLSSVTRTKRFLIFFLMCANFDIINDRAGTATAIDDI